VEGVSDANRKLLQVSTLSALQVTIDGIGQFLSPYLRDIIQIVISIPDNYATHQVTSFLCCRIAVGFLPSNLSSRI
jgi:hypothetical protein